MSTAQRVFGTTELLEMVICQVDAHQIRELKLVSKEWRDVVLTSKAVARTRVNTGWENSDDQQVEDLNKVVDQRSLAEKTYAAFLESEIFVSSYSWEDWIRVNPAFKKVHFAKLGGGRSWEVVIRLPSPAKAKARLNLDEFVTSPPCEYLTLNRLYWSFDDSEWYVPPVPTPCVAFNEKGLSIRDVLAVRDQLAQTADSRAHAIRRQEVVVSFIVHYDFLEPKSDEYTRVRDSYFGGPLPRYRKASHRLGPEGVKAYLKDQALEWSPDMDV